MLIAFINHRQRASRACEVCVLRVTSQLMSTSFCGITPSISKSRGIASGGAPANLPFETTLLTVHCYLTDVPRPEGITTINYSSPSLSRLLITLNHFFRFDVMQLVSGFPAPTVSPSRLNVAFQHRSERKSPTLAATPIKIRIGTTFLDHIYTSLLMGKASLIPTFEQ